MIFKFFIFVFFLIIGFPLSLWAEDKVDYDKPFPEIKEQVSSFDSRHSLMPVEEKKESVEKNTVEKKSSLTFSNLQDDELEKPNVAEVPNEPVNAKVEVKKDDDFETVIISGKDDDEDIKDNFELREEKLSVVLKPTPLKKDNAIRSDVIDEKVGDMVSKPLFNDNVEKKSHTDISKSYFIETEDDMTSLAHVASYTTEESAYDGLKMLEKKYPQFNIFEPYVKYENVPNKGWYYRLYLVGDRRELSMLCKDMKKNNDWCFLE